MGDRYPTATWNRITYGARNRAFQYAAEQGLSDGFSGKVKPPTLRKNIKSLLDDYISDDSCNSFVSGTEVLMADGERKPG
jgi:hypothetical protein